MERFIQDLKYSARTLRRSPGFTALATLTMAIGIGANTAIFSIVNAVLLRPLPFPRPDDLVLVSQIDRQTKQTFDNAAPANFLDWRARSHSFTGLAAERFTRIVMTGGDRPESLNGATVNANFFDVLQVKPAMGRAFTSADERPGAPRAAIVSDGFWRRGFGGRTDAIGQSVRLNDEPTTIVGVMPAGIEYPGKADVWITPHWRVPDDPQLAPGIDPSAERGHGYISVLGRLKPGVTIDAAQAEMNVVAAGLERDYPDDNQNVGVALVSLRSDLVADVRPIVRLLFAAVALLLLIAAANVSGLLIVRATARQQEVALRLALGATRRRVLAQLLTESVALATIGGACGVIVAMWLIGPLVALSPASLNVAGDVRIDTTVLLFALAVSVGSGLLFGLAPARQLIHVDLHEDLKQSGRVSGGAQRRARAALVAAEIALSLVLLVAAGLTIRSFVRLGHVSTGFDIDDIITVAVNPPAARYPVKARLADFYEHVVNELRDIPGVQMAAATSRLPLVPGNSTRGLTIPGVPPDAPAVANYRTASPDYFRVMGIPVISGRVFTDADREGRPIVAVISASLAQQFWLNRDPIGSRFSMGDSPITIVGVVGDVHAAALDAPVRPTVYVPYRQDAFPAMTFVVRTPAPIASMDAAIRAAISHVDREQPVGAITTMDAQLANSLSRRRFAVTLLAAFGAVAVALAAVGLYGVLAFIVVQRRREIGVRMALGASPRDVVADVFGQGLRLAAIGIGAGIVLSLATMRLVRSLLFGISPTDMATFATVASLVVAIAAIASAVPALRASRVDPLVALRDE
jgi:putative ABC transport system permease protein